MELISNISKPRKLTMFDMVCGLLVGLGLGISGMYYYTSRHPEVISHSRTTVVVLPKQVSNPKVTTSTNKPALTIEQF
ncbi:MAG TPA: hypothetical protein VLF39_00590 [Candidatus Saccharimonadales bacterium]|nr:hypothetical protein [Candidatus Saccharimonadales bacterium]